MPTGLADLAAAHPNHETADPLVCDQQVRSSADNGDRDILGARQRHGTLEFVGSIQSEEDVGRTTELEGRERRE